MYMVEILSETGHHEGWLGGGRCKQRPSNAKVYHAPSAAKTAAKGYWRRSPTARLVLWRTRLGCPAYRLDELQSEEA